MVAIKMFIKDFGGSLNRVHIDTQKKNRLQPGNQSENYSPSSNIWINGLAPFSLEKLRYSIMYLGKNTYI